MNRLTAAWQKLLDALDPTPDEDCPHDRIDDMGACFDCGRILDYTEEVAS